LKKVYLFIMPIFLFFLVLSLNTSKYKVATNPDFLHYNFFSQLLQENNTIEYCNDYNLKYNVSIFGSRGMKITLNQSCLTHGKMHGFIIIIAIFRFISKNILFLINPLFVIVTYIYLYKIINFYTHESEALFISLLFLFSPYYLYFSSIFFDNAAFLSSFVVSIYYFLKFNKKENIEVLILGTFFLGVSMWLRYESIVLYLSLFPILYNKKNKWRKVLVVIAIFLLFLIPMWIVNKRLYGSLLGFSDPNINLANSNYYFKNRPNQISNIIPFLSFDIFLKNFVNFMIDVNIQIFYFFVLSVIFILFDKTSIITKKEFLFFIFIIMINTLFYLGNIWAGFDPPKTTIGTSYCRYLFPAYISLFVISSQFIIVFLKNKKIITFFFVFIFIIFSFDLVINSKEGLGDFFKQQEKAISIKNSFIKLIPNEKAIIFTSYYDKYIFPDRLTAIYTSFPEDKRINQTVDIIEKLILDNEDVYFIESDWGTNYDIFKSSDYFEGIENRNLTIEKESGSIFRIVKVS